MLKCKQKLLRKYSVIKVEVEAIKLAHEYGILIPSFVKYFNEIVCKTCFSFIAFFEEYSRMCVPLDASYLEKGTSSRSHNTLPKASIQGCVFHWTQARPQDSRSGYADSK